MKRQLARSEALTEFLNKWQHVLLRHQAKSPPIQRVERIDGYRRRMVKFSWFAWGVFSFSGVLITKAFSNVALSYT
jgi:hypothetical protein